MVTISILLNYNDMMIETISNLSQHLKVHFKKDMLNRRRIRN
jgi:ribosomal protein S15P/S13E